MKKISPLLIGTAAIAFIASTASVSTMGVAFAEENALRASNVYVAQDGADRTSGVRVAQDGADRASGVRVAQDGSDRNAVGRLG